MSTEKDLNGLKLEVVQGDIANQPDCEAIINAANAQLETGGGVAGAIHRAAGPGLAKECRPKAPIQPGQAVISGGHNLPNEHVIHCLGPVYGINQPENELLANCYKNALTLADQHQIRNIAFPAISTGAFGYPFQEAVKVALKTIEETVPDLKYVQTIRFVLFSKKDLETAEYVIKEQLK